MDPERLFSSNLDKEIKDLIKQHFEYFDLHLSNSSFMPFDPAHQTADSLKMCIGKIVKFYS